MKASECALKAAKLYDSDRALNCCHALSIASNGEKFGSFGLTLSKIFQRYFTERVFIDERFDIDDLSDGDIDQFRVFLLLFFAEWLKDQGI